MPTLSHSEARVAGLSINGFSSIEEAADLILQDARSGKGGFALAINAEKIMATLRSDEIRSVLESATMRFPDGIGAVWAMRQKGVKSIKVPGVEIWLAVLRRAAELGESPRVAVLGSEPSVLERTTEKLAGSPWQANIVLARDGFEGVSDRDTLSREVQAARPQLVFVAMGSPRQELLINELRKHWPQAYYFGLGGSFDVLVGKVKRAPVWSQKLGCEWLYRLVTQPSRLRRQLRILPIIYLYLTRQL